MHPRNTLLTAAILGLAVAAGLLGVGGTWALWSASVPSNAGTIQSATFDVDVNGSPMPQGARAVWEDQAQQLTPTSPVYAIITVKNDTEAGAAFAIRTDVGPARAQGTSASDLGGVLIMDLANMPKSGKCSDGVYAKTASASPIGKLGSELFCLKMSLPNKASPALSGASTVVAIPVTATQVSEGA